MLMLLMPEMRELEQNNELWQRYPHWTERMEVYLRLGHGEDFLERGSRKTCRKIFS
jgi:hypothetical protein